MDKSGGDILLDIRFESFLKICELKSYTKAAKELNLTQPAVSQHIKSLENEYKNKFLIYKGKDLVLTNAGKVLLNHAKKMKINEKFFAEKMMLANSDIKSIKFGATLTIGEFTLETILGDMFKEFNNYDFMIYVENTKKILSMLESGELHFALVEGLFDKSKYSSKILKNERFILTISKNHSFACRKNIKIEDLLFETLIVREKGSGSREILERALYDKNLGLDSFKKKIEIGNVNLIKNLINLDIGISFMYRDAAKKDIEAGNLIEVEIEDFVIKKEFNFVYIENEVYEKELSFFHKFFKNNMNKA